MIIKSATVHGHLITIRISLWSGKEQVLYDDRVVSEKSSFLFVTPHSFTIDEDGEASTYEVNVLSGFFSLGYIVRRNGIIVAHQP